MNEQVTGKHKVLFPKVLAIAVILLSARLGISGSVAYAQGVQPPPPNPTSVTNSEYLTTVTMTLPDGTSLTDTIIHGPPVPPPGFDAQRAAVTVMPASAKTLAVPAFTWVFGCSAVSGAMIAGYYDRNGYPNMYAGPTAGGVMPLTDSSWPTWSDGHDTYPNNPLIASHKGVDGRTSRGSIDDYWVGNGSTAADPFLPPPPTWTQHAWGSAIGDYMKTSQSSYGNVDGSTQFFNYTSSASKLTCAAMPTMDAGGGRKISEVDGTYGRKLFYEARGSIVTDCYNQKTDNTIVGGFSLANYKAQIDANRPILLNLAGHSIVGVGYGSGSTIYIHDTWDTSNHTMTWGKTYSGLELQSVSVVNLEAIPTPISPSGVTSDTTPAYVWSKIGAATNYNVELWNSAGTYRYYSKTGGSCGPTTCIRTPAIVLDYGSYEWRVRAFVGGVWKAFSAFKAFTITNVPTPLHPTGTITDTTPTFTWTRIYGATQYRFAVYNGSTLAYPMKTVAASACGPSGANCSNTPSNVLSLGAHTWKVQAYVGGVWRAYSAYKSFVIVP